MQFVVSVGYSEKPTGRPSWVTEHAPCQSVKDTDCVAVSFSGNYSVLSICFCNHSLQNRPNDSLCSYTVSLFVYRLFVYSFRGFFQTNILI